MKLGDPACDPENPIHVGLDEILEAQCWIGNSIVQTPCIKSHLSELTGTELYIKNEFLQYTGSFKERGARNMLEHLLPSQKKSGVIGASTGNHALALSYHGLQLGIPVTVVMPVCAPLMKREKCKTYKANVVIQGVDLDEAKKIALRMSVDKCLTYVNGHDHPMILAGAGTIGLEILEQVPDVETIIVPTGGGGLLAGVASAVKNSKCDVKIIGVEAENCQSMVQALEKGKPVKTTCRPSLADALSVPMVGVNAFETARRYIDEMIIVKEEHIALAILALLEKEKCIVEGAGAIPLAAMLSGLLPHLKGTKVVIILSGGNIDTSVLSRVIERCLGVLGKLLKFSVAISDKPGGISELLNALTGIGANIKHVLHERTWVIGNVFTVNVTVICECLGIDHAVAVKKVLQESYEDVDFSYFPNVCTARILGN